MDPTPPRTSEKRCQTSSGRASVAYRVRVRALFRGAQIGIDLVRCRRKTARMLSGMLLAAGGQLTAISPLQAQPEPQTNPVYVDEWATATETFLGLSPLLAAGNLDGAVRGLQKLLDEDAGRVVAVSSDPDLFIGVRTRVHESLLANANRLSPYPRI